MMNMTYLSSPSLSTCMHQLFYYNIDNLVTSLLIIVLRQLNHFLTEEPWSSTSLKALHLTPSNVVLQHRSFCCVLITCLINHFLTEALTLSCLYRHNYNILKLSKGTYQLFSYNPDNFTALRPTLVLCQLNYSLTDWVHFYLSLP